MVHRLFPNSEDSIIFSRGNKIYELVNNIVNVLATISDKRYGVPMNDSIGLWGTIIVTLMQTHLMIYQDLQLLINEKYLFICLYFSLMSFF